MPDKLEGGCTCGHVRYRLTAAPMVTHCCHCTWCQRETGSAFAVNAVIEMAEVERTGAEPEIVLTPSLSGKGQEIARCPRCHVAVWSHYSTAGRAAAFIRVGTLDDNTAIAPDVHIFTSTRVPWLELTDGKPAFDEFYPSPEGVWSPDARRRWAELMTHLARPGQ
ncbi:MAG TPA: GFA family protein [Hyphomonas sp.]|nr:GFA family protein [Hyphomonas sp.]MCA8904984.1 GFA family protein [Hyphomonas sp.]MCB9961221.1 GFA family protein [Hyphomonas sp.]MCB9970512.1 GFA family protein [Hyphomonas sp.]HPE49383.1 GFA family protein [Hyphomonas sp.]